MVLFRKFGTLIYIKAPSLDFGGARHNPMATRWTKPKARPAA